MKTSERDFIEELERLDAFCDGTEPGEVPLDVLRARGVELPEDEQLDDEALHRELWKAINAMADIGMYLDSTDHLSDRELYRWLRNDALREEALLSDDPAGAWFMSPIGGGSEEDNHNYLRYYADDEDRASWQQDFGEPLPPKTPPPFDRDRLLP